MLFQKRLNQIRSKISIDPTTKCWNWLGKLDKGYGKIYWQGKKWKAHRLFYFFKHGEIEEWTNKQSKEVDHICNNRACVNPAHLRLVSSKVNVLRGVGATAINARKTECIHGHRALYSLGYRRRCRECRRILDASEKRREWRKKRSLL